MLPVKPVVKGIVKVGKIFCPSPSITIRPLDKENRLSFSCR